MLFTTSHVHSVAAAMRKVQNDTSKLISVLALCEMFQQHIPHFRAIEFYQECGLSINEIVRLTMKGRT